MSTNVARDVAAAVGARTVLIPTPYVCKLGRCSDAKSFVRTTYDQFIRLDGRGSHFPNARAWCHERMVDGGDAEMFFFKFMLLVCETETVGSVRCHADYVSEPNAYAETVKLAALGPYANKSEAATLRALTTSDRKVNLRFNHDVAQERKVVAALRGGNSRKKSKASANKNATPAQLPLPLNVSYYMGAFSIRIDTTANVREVDIGLMTRSADLSGQVLRRKRCPAAAPAAEKDDDEAVPVPASEPYAGPENPLRSKVTFTVTPVPVLGGDLRNPNDIAGVYVRFLVHDEGINPGVFFEDLCTNARRRASQALSGGGEKRGGRGAGPVEMFPQYASLFESSHPAGTNVGPDTYFKHALAIDPTLTESASRDALMNEMQIRTFKNRFHLCKLLSTSRACRIAIEAGCDPAMMAPHLWWSENTGVAKFPAPERATTYVYLPSQVFWHRESHIGLREHYFPHIDMDSDFLATLVAGGKIERFLSAGDPEDDARSESEQEQEDVSKIRGAFHRFRYMIQNNHLIERASLMDNTLVDYQTNNEFVHRAAEARIINSRVAQFKPAHYEVTYDEVHAIIETHGANRWRDVVAFDAKLEAKLAECERYNELRQKSQAACTKTFTGLWQLEGDVDGLPVPEPIRAMLKWFRDNQYSRFPHVTREFIMWDPDLSVFGNSMLRQLKFYACVARILQPIVCLLCEGLFSCYRWSPAQLAFNLLFHGRYDTGKSYAAITTLLLYTTIPKTVKTYCNSTPAADTTQNHKYDVIIASDEVMPWKVNEREAKKVPERVNKEKVKLTDRKVSLDTFTRERGPNGEDVRWSRTITSDHYVSLLEITNEPVEATAALSSRSHRMVVAQPRVPAREMQGEMGASLDEHAKTYLQLNQFLSAGAYKLIQCGGMLEPDLQLFHDISNRVVDYLVREKAIDKDSGSRNLDIMKPYVIQCIIHNAIHCVFDMPSGPHYRKPFRAEMLQDLQPYMYATVDIVWWCWTALASGWIEQNNRNVIRAAIKTAIGSDEVWVEDATPYAMYEIDKEEKIPWRRHNNQSHQHSGGSNKDANAKLIDLQYITLRGDMETVCRSISSNTVPHLDWTDVKGILQVLSTTMVSLPGGGYRLQEEGTFKNWHKYTQLPDADGVSGLKEVDHDGSMMPAIYRFREPNTTIARCEADVPRYGPDAKGTVVEINRHGFVHFMPHIAESYSNGKIIDALKYATLHKNMRPGKYLMGLPMEDDPTLMRVFTCSQRYLDKVVVALDEEAGWDPHGEWIGNRATPERQRGTPRSTGISFNRRGGISKTDSVFFTYAPAAPVKPGEQANWDLRAHHDVDSISALQQLSTDLDADSAKRRHMICGRPLDEPVRTPEYILTQYKRAVAALGERPSWHANVDYPYQNIAENADRTDVWVNSSDVNTASAVFRSDAIRDSNYDRPRDDDLHRALVARRNLLTSSRLPSSAPPTVHHVPAEGAPTAVITLQSVSRTGTGKRTREEQDFQEALDEMEG